MTKLLQLIMSFYLIGLASVANAQGQNHEASAGRLCYVSKNTKLAMDQRDDARIACMKQKITDMNVDICLSVANAMEYSTNAEETRMLCLYNLKKPINIKECLKISKAMEYPDSGDEVRWDCIRRFSKSITKKQCQFFANSMSYPPNHQRAEIYCSQEIN